MVSRATFGRRGTQHVSIDDFREHIGADLAADIGALLANGATFDGEPLKARDVAVIVENHKDARACHRALTEAGIPSVYTGDSDVFGSDAADDWLSLLEAFDQPHRPGVVRAAAATMFFGETAESLAAGGDALTDRVAETLREWAGHARERGVAAIFEAAQLRGMSDRVLSWHDGERHMTDLAHMTQLLQDAAHRNHYTLPALRDWLRTQRAERSGATEHFRRLDNDAAAVQIMTVFVSKGLQYPIVYLPFAFNRNIKKRDLILFHDEGVRCLHIGGKDSPTSGPSKQLGRKEAASDDSRLTYVAMTRAQAQVVAWWAPARDEPNGGLSRLLRGRRPGESAVPDRCEPAKISDDDALARFREWEAAGGPVIEESVISSVPSVPAEPAPSDLDARHFHRAIDTAWRRTSYSGLIRVAETSGVSSEPEVVELDDEVGDIPLVAATSGPDVPSPMAELPTGAKFGTLVHAVLETADPFAADLAAELEAQIREHSVWWPVDVAPDALAAAMVPMHDTPLGPLADGLTLRQIGLRDRLRELDFEFPLAGGDLRVGCAGHSTGRRRVSVALAPARRRSARVVCRPVDRRRARQPVADAGTSAARSTRCCGSAAGTWSSTTRRTGSVIPTAPLTAADYDRRGMTEAMLHSDYPLQALLYSVVLHRLLAMAVPEYEPDAAPGRGAVSVRARHVRAGYPGGRRPSGRGVQLAAAGVAGDGVVGSARCGEGSRMTVELDVATWRQAVGADGIAAHLQRRGGDRGSGCSCGAAAYSRVPRGGRAGSTGRRFGSSGASWRLGVCGSAVGRGAGRGRRPAVAGSPTSGWRRFGLVRWPARRPCCGSTTICSTSTGTGAKSSRSPTTCWR